MENKRANTQTQSYSASEPGVGVINCQFQRITSGFDLYDSWRTDVTTAGAVLTEAAHILNEAAPPVTITDLAKSGVDAVVWDASSSRRRTT